MVHGGSLTHKTEDGHSLVGSVENLASDCMFYSCPPALYDLFPGSPIWDFSLGLHLFTNVSFVHSPDLLTTGHSYLLHTVRVFVGKRGLTCTQTSHYFRPTLWTACLQVSVTLCAVIRFTCFHLHKVPGGLPSYILQTGSGWMDGRDVYGVM